MNEIFLISNKEKSKNNFINISSHENLRNYIKKGTIKENAIDELYKRTTKKLDDGYRNRLSLLLYNGRNVNDYFTKRVNLDNVTIKINTEDKLYITLSNFKDKEKASSQNKEYKNNKYSKNYTNNGSNCYICDNSNNSNNSHNINKNKIRLRAEEAFGNWQEIILNKNIDKLLLNESEEIPINIQKQIWTQLRDKYNFMKDEKKQTNHSKIFNNYKVEPLIKNSYSYFPKRYDKKFNSNIKLIKEKTDELNKLKSRRYKNYLSPIFFLGKSRDKFLHQINYNLSEKFIKEINKQDINDIKKENVKYLNIIEKDIIDLHEVNKNKDDNII